MPAKLTVKALQALKPADIGTTVRDEGGIWGKVRKAGEGVSVTFWYRYRWQNKTRDTAVGTWPAVGLPEIRKNRDTARTLVANDIDPNEQREIDRRQREAEQAAQKAELAAKDARLTVRQLFERWEALGLSSRKDDGAETKRGLEKDVLPALGGRYAADIKRADLMAILDAVKSRGANRLANRLLAEMRQMFAFGLTREIVLSNPADGITKKAVGGADVERDRVLTPDEIRQLPAKLDAANLTDTTKHAVWLLLATSARAGELAKARRADIDLDKAEWRIPPEHAKNATAHTIYLSPFALLHMQALLDASTSKVWLMPATRGESESHVDSKSITKQIADRQLKFYDRKAHSKRTTKHANALVIGEKNWTPHDLRRTSATLMQTLGVLPVVIEACLNHTEPNRIVRTYQTHDYAAEKREAWRLLGDRLDLLTRTDVDNVVMLSTQQASA